MPNILCNQIPDNLFNKDMNDIKDKAQNMDLIEYRPKGILVKILDKIKKFFKIN